MFDDPKKDLQRLQEKLLAAEAPEQPEWEADEDDDPEEALRQMKALLNREEWEQTEREPLYRSYTRDDGYGEDFEAEFEEPVPAPRKKETERSIGGLLTAMVLEAIALLILMIWWLLWK